LYRQMRIAQLAESAHQILVKVVDWIDWNIVRARDSHMNDFTRAIGQFNGACFADAGECSREVGVILHRDEAVEREHTKRRILPYLIASFPVGAASGGKGIDDFLHAKRSRAEL